MSPEKVFSLNMRKIFLLFGFAFLYVGLPASLVLNGWTLGQHGGTYSSSRRLQSGPYPVIPSGLASTSVEKRARPTISFEANRGQAGPGVNFLSRGDGYSLLLTGDGVQLQLHGGGSKPVSVGMKLVGANPSPNVEGKDPLKGRSHYFLGRASRAWVRDVPHFSRVQYSSVYPGVDLVYYGIDGQIEFDYVVDRGINPEIISFDFPGSTGVKVDEQGDLMISVGDRRLSLHRPHAYQVKGGKETAVAAVFRSLGQGRIGFDVSEFDPGLPLVIDPILSYSTYFGGSEDDRAIAIKVDSFGNIYFAGVTFSAGFPGTNPDQPGSFGGGELFVTKLNAAGNQLIYSSYIGGSGPDTVPGLAVDDSGSVYLTGGTRSANFPISADAFQSSLHGVADTFVLKLNPEGNNFVFSTYLGGSGEEGSAGGGIAIDGFGNAYVTGATNSQDFPIFGSIFQRDFGGGSSDAFVTKLGGDGHMVYSTYLGGFDEDGGRAIAVDSSGSCYVTGKTRSANFPVFNGYQSVTPGYSDDVFLTKFNITGGLIFYSTFLGGSGDDSGNGLAVGNSGVAYVAGETKSIDFPTTSGAFKKDHPGADSDGFLAQFKTTASQAASLAYCTYLGGSGNDRILGLAVGGAGLPHVAGTTDSVDFPLQDAFQSAFAGGEGDGFVAKLNSGASGLIYSSYLGGNGGDSIEAIAVGPQANAFVAGSTQSGDFPTANALQPGFGGKSDSFIARIPPGDGSPGRPVVASGIVVSPKGSIYSVAENIFATFTIINRGGSFLNLSALTLVEGDTSNQVPDFPPLRNIVVEPGDSFTYSRILTLTQVGSFTFTVAYQTADGVWHTDITTEGDATNHVTISVENPGGVAVPVNSIAVSSNPCQISFAATGCKTTVSWRAVNIEGNAQVMVEDLGVGGPQTVFASGVAGSADATWIAPPPHKYKFTLYDVSLGQNLALASVEVTGQETAPAFRGTVTASSNPCIIPSGGTVCGTTISWTTNTAITNAILFVEDVGAGDPASGVDVGTSGSVDVGWIQGPPHRYIFTLFEITGTSLVPVAAIEVTGKQTDQVGNISGMISAMPNPCVISSGASSCSTTINWSTSDHVTYAKVSVTDVGAGASATFFASGRVGSVSFDSVQSSPHRYRFTLYQIDAGRAIELVSTEVTGGASP